MNTEQTDMCILALGARLAPVGQPLATGSFVHLSYCSVSWKEGEEREGGGGERRRVRKVNTPSVW